MLVEPGNIEKLAEAITLPLTDHVLRNRLSGNAYRYAQGFSWDKTAEKFLEVVEGAIHG